MVDSKEYARLLVEDFPNGIVFIYEGREPPRYSFVGGRGLDTLGLSAEELEESPVAQNRPRDVRNTLRTHYRRALDGEEVTLESELEGRHFRIQLFPLADTDETTERAMGIARDITEQKVYEQELQRQNERLERLTDTLAHDLRNPLEVIRGRLELLRDDCDSEHLDAIARAERRMESIIDEMLEHRTGSKELSTVSLDTVAKDAWRNVATDDAELRIDGDGQFLADGAELRRVFENLYRNAVEHGRAVTVTVGPLEDGFYVEDDGPGIDPDDRERVFDRGYTGGDGTGLGLFIVETIADAHGWDVTVTDGSDGGARFEFTGVEVE